MRRVRFSWNFRKKAMFADENTLDFVISFMKGDIINDKLPEKYSFISVFLINSYFISS
jgi:hypothetical protein